MDHAQRGKPADLGSLLLLGFILIKDAGEHAHHVFGDHSEAQSTLTLALALCSALALAGLQVLFLAQPRSRVMWFAVITMLIEFLHHMLSSFRELHWIVLVARFARIAGVLALSCSAIVLALSDNEHLAEIMHFALALFILMCETMTGQSALFVQGAKNERSANRQALLLQ